MPALCATRALLPYAPKPSKFKMGQSTTPYLAASCQLHTINSDIAAVAPRKGQDREQCEPAAMQALATDAIA